MSARVAATELPALLERTDVLVSLLPASSETDRAFGADLLERLPRHAMFVNVGRGTTVDEEALVAALRAGRLRVAALDVTRVEPLPVDSELWSAPNLLLTPHAAGNRPQNATALVQESVDAIRDGRTVRNALEWTGV